jgi:hypothetical protein
MDPLERAIGRVEQKIDSHSEFEHIEHAKIERRFDSLEEKMDSLMLWRASIIGMAGVVSGFVGLVAGFFGAKL